MIKSADLLHENGDQLCITENAKVGFVNIDIRLHEFNKTLFNSSVIEFTAHVLSFDQVLKKAQQYGFEIVRKGE